MKKATFFDTKYQAIFLLIRHGCNYIVSVDQKMKSKVTSCDKKKDKKRQTSTIYKTSIL